jgi:hypothetical protein
MQQQQQFLLLVCSACTKLRSTGQDMTHSGAAGLAYLLAGMAGSHQLQQGWVAQGTGAATLLMT